MRQFLSFVKKEWYHIIRDRRTVLILLGIPIMQILLFGFAITTEVKNARLAVFDPSHDEMTQQIKSHFQASERFILTEELTSPHEINDVFTRGKADLVLIFGERFAENLRHTGEASVQLIIDGAEPNQASMMSGYAQQILYMYRQELAGEHLPSCRITAQVKMLYNPQGKSVFYFVPGIMGMILTLICGMMTSIAIVREKRNRYDGTVTRLTDEAGVYYFSQNRALFRTVGIESRHHSDHVRFRTARTDSRKLDLADCCFATVHFSCSVGRAVYFRPCRQSNSCHAGLGYGHDDARHVAFGYDLSRVQYARCITMALGRRTCPLVHSGRKENHDTRCRTALCAERDCHSYGYGFGLCRLKLETI